jgi:hypothetical protein
MSNLTWYFEKCAALSIPSEEGILKCLASAMTLNVQSFAVH